MAAFAFEELLKSLPGSDKRAKALSLIKVAEDLTAAGKVDEATAQVREAQAIFDESKYEEGRGVALVALSKIQLKRARDEEDHDEAADYATGAQRLFQKLSYKRGEAAALTVLASVYYGLRDAALSVRSSKEALAIYLDINDRKAAAETLHTLAYAYLLQRDTRRAALQINKAIAIYQELGDKAKEAAGLARLAAVEGQGRDFSKAEEAVSRARELFRSLADHEGEAQVLRTLRDIRFQQQNDFVAGVQVAKEITTLYHRAGDRRGEGRALVDLGEILLKNGDHQRAGEIGKVALGIFHGIGYQDGLKLAKELLEAARYEKVKEDIELALARNADYVHIPQSLIIDPGFNTRIQEKFAKFTKGV